MGKSIKLFRINGIPIGLHPSWFIIFLFLTWSLANGYFADRASSLPFAGIWALGLLTSLLFFGSVLAHELGHAFVALRNGIPVKSISLFFLGGVAEIDREPEAPGEEFRIAIAGPMVSLALALAFNSLSQVSGGFPYLAAAFQYLGRVNLLLGVFNLIPGFPMDGHVADDPGFQSRGSCRRNQVGFAVESDLTEPRAGGRCLHIRWDSESPRP